MLRPTRTGVAGHVAVAATMTGSLTTEQGASSATRAAQPAIAAQPGVISLQGATGLPDLSCPAMQSGIPAIADACCCTIAVQGTDANATPCPARPRTTPSRSR